MLVFGRVDFAEWNLGKRPRDGQSLPRFLQSESIAMDVVKFFAVSMKPMHTYNLKYGSKDIEDICEISEKAPPFFVVLWLERICDMVYR